MSVEGRQQAQKVAEIAPFENDVQFRRSFAICLNTSIQDIQLEEYEAPSEEEMNIEWSKLKCTRCSELFLETEQFMAHVLKCIFTPTEETWYYKYGLVTSSVDKVVKEAQEVRAATSFIVKNFANIPNIRFKVPIKSPLGPFLIRGISIYLNTPPPSTEMDKVVKGQLQIGKKTHRLYFNTGAVEKQIEEVLAVKKEHARQKYLLARWRSLKKVSSKDIVAASEDKENMKPKAKERKRLASAFAPDYLAPEAAKRVPKQKKPMDL